MPRGAALTGAISAAPGSWHVRVKLQGAASRGTRCSRPLLPRVDPHPPRTAPIHPGARCLPGVQVIPSNFQIRGMHTIIRDRDTATPDFVFYSDRLLRLVVEASLGHLPFRRARGVAGGVLETSAGGGTAWARPGLAAGGKAALVSACCC